VHYEKHHPRVQSIVQTAVCGFYGERGDLMVSQANFFRDDVSGKLYDTPAEALYFERKSLNRKEYLASLSPIKW